MKLLSAPYFDHTTKAAPLAVFRICFGLMMALSVVRFWSLGWIDKLYIQPTYFFSYYGFEFIKPLGPYTYLLFLICGLSAVAVAVGFKYRLAIITFFLSFTYIELMDKTTYLNHYYFISLLSFLMIFLPANRYFSWDASHKPGFTRQYVPTWSVDAVKLLLAIVYFYAGLAKLNSDWLFNAMPLKIWLPASYDLPVLGDFLQKTWIIFAFSWAGALYDLAIPFLLVMKRTRLVAFIMVIVFHVLTRMLFPIGMFPFIMIVSALIFFDAHIHEKVLNLIGRLIKVNRSKFDNSEAFIPTRKNLTTGLLAVFFAVQIIFPFRHLAYADELFWTEEGFRFSWRVMLIEKAGYASFTVVDGQDGSRLEVDNSEFLTAFQEKQMATQPDFILEYAHFLKEEYENRGMKDVAIYVDSYVALNGRRSRRYIDPMVNLAEQKESFEHKDWILPFKDEIKGI